MLVCFEVDMEDQEFQMPNITWNVKWFVLKRALLESEENTRFWKKRWIASMDLWDRGAVTSSQVTVNHVESV
jgi:hypothetical protein